MTAIMALALLGCSGEPPESTRRLVPIDDLEFERLEEPETPGECAGDLECEVSCEQRCITVPTGPVTCPVEPVPVPERVASAPCICADSVCAWWPPDAPRE